MLKMVLAADRLKCSFDGSLVSASRPRSIGITRKARFLPVAALFIESIVFCSLFVIANFVGVVIAVKCTVCAT